MENLPESYIFEADIFLPLHSYKRFASIFDHSHEGRHLTPIQGLRKSLFTGPTTALGGP